MTNHEELHNSLTYFVALVPVTLKYFSIFSQINDFSPSSLVVNVLKLLYLSSLEDSDRIFLLKVDVFAYWHI